MDSEEDERKGKKKGKKMGGGNLESWKIKRDKQRRWWEVGEELFPRGITLGVSLHWSF